MSDESMASLSESPAAAEEPPPPPAPPRVTPTAATRAKSNGSGEASLSESDGSAKISFDFNPEMIKIGHNAPTDKLGLKKISQGGDAETAGIGSPNVVLTADEAVRAAGTTTINISNVVFDGKAIKQTCDQLLEWSHPLMSSGSTKILVYLPLLKFQWGSFRFTATLNSVNVSYTRFSSRGTPTRAKVDLTFHQNDQQRKATNPSSGGLPGRREHVLTSGECLPLIATASYGGPGDWRPLADANHIDDPLRVRPGTVLYLPGPGELARPLSERP